MASTTPRGLHVWDLGTDQFDHDELAANWAKIEQIVSAGTQSAEILGGVPVSANFPGRLVMLSAADGGFAAWTLIRYDGSQWRAIGPFEILPSVPVSGNYAGRVIILSTANGGFAAWDIIRYNGSTWGIVGGWATVNTGAGATNILGMQTAQDVYVNVGTRGFVFKDRTTGVTRRLYLDNGVLQTEVVT